MKVAKQQVTIGAMTTACLLALTPLTISPTEGISQASAACETCCPEETTTCVVCSGKCIVAPNYYEKEIGTPCSQP